MLEQKRTVLQEAQGYTRTQSNSRLVYDYKGCSQESKHLASKSQEKVSTPEKEPLAATWKSETHRIGVRTQANKNSPRSPAMSAAATIGSSVKSPATIGSSCDPSTSRTPEKSARSAINTVSNNRMPARFGGYNGSPKSPIKSSPGSVLSKASLFESKGTEVKAKDPAEMSLVERMALFERNNKGEAPLIPKAPLTMSVPTKKLLEREKSNNGQKSPQKFTGELFFIDFFGELQIKWREVENEDFGCW